MLCRLDPVRPAGVGFARPGGVRTSATTFVVDLQVSAIIGTMDIVFGEVDR